MNIDLKNFEDCIENVKYGNKVQRSHYLEEGSFPIVSQELDLVSGYWNNADDVFEVKKPVIIFGDHTRTLKYVDFSFVLGADGAKIIKPKDFIDSKFLYYFLLANPIESKGYSRHYKYLKELKLKVPSLLNQQKIVAKLDTIFAEIDKAIAMAEANAKNAEALFQSYLTEVFGRGCEGWKLSTLNEISENLDSKRVPITKGVRKAGDTPYYGASGIVDYVEGHIFNEDILLISEDGANLLARTYPIAFSVTGKSWVNNHAHVLKFSNLATQYFVEFYLNSIPLNSYVSGMAQPKLNQTMLNKIPIPTPSLDEQIKLVDTFHAFKEASVTAKNAYLNKAHQLSSLKNSILQQAFNGELVKD